MAADFTCCECGQEVTRFAVDRVPEFRLCFLCMEMPGWFRIPQMRAFLRTNHDGREIWERASAPMIELPPRRTDL